MSYSQDELLEKYKNLPRQLQEAIFAEATADKMHAIGSKNSLTINQIGEMASETGYVILGFTHPRDFVSTLTERLFIDQEKARSIAEDINREIFRPIREHLKELHYITGRDVVSEKEIDLPPTPKAPPAQSEIQKPEGRVANEPRPTEVGRAPMIFPQKIEEEHEEPKETIEVPRAEPEPQKPETKQEARQERPVETKKYEANDPYREPIE